MPCSTRWGALKTLAVGLLFLGGCNSSNEITAPLATPARAATGTPAPTLTATLAPTATSTPAPVPTSTPSASSVSGSWTGVFDEEDYKGSSADCETHVSASATLHQIGSHVSGSFRIEPSACWEGGQIDGSLSPLPDGSSQTFEGSVHIAGWTGGAFTGRVTATTIHIGIAHLTRDLGNGTGLVAPGGLLTLQR